MIRHIYCILISAILLQNVSSYSKFGRKCDDIGCASNEECVMATKTCSYYDRQDECGEYPTCKKISNNARSCDTYVCPPSKVCKIDAGTPKCFDDSRKDGNVQLYDTSNLNSKYDNKNEQINSNTNSNNDGYNPSHSPSAPKQNGGSIYPGLSGNSDYRPPVGYPNPGYQSRNNYGGYQLPGYNQNSRPNNGYGQQNSGYGSNSYNQGGYKSQQGVSDGFYVAGSGYQQPSRGGSDNNRRYNNGYRYNQDNQGYGSSGYGNNGYGNNGYGQNRYGQKNGASSSFADSLKESLKKIGFLILLVQYFTQTYCR